MLDGYWDRMPPAEIKAGILADWADTLEDWNQEQVVYALRKWRDANPSRKPNPGHILCVLKELRGRKEAQRMAVSVQDDPEAERKEHTAEMRARVSAMVGEMGVGKRIGGAA